jgi:hypothetical protein
MNDKLHLFEGYNRNQLIKIFKLAFKDEAENKLKEFEKSIEGKPRSDNNLDDFLKKNLKDKSFAEINVLINEALKPNTGNEDNKDKEDKEDKAAQLKSNYDAAKKAYSDKVEAIKKGIDLDTIGTRITTLADNATKLNMPAEEVQKIKKNAGEAKRTAGIILEGIGAVLSVFPGLEGVAQIAGGLGAVFTKYGNKAAEEAAKEAENFDKNKQVLSQVGINSKEEYETALNNIIAQNLNSLPKYLERAVKNNPTLEQETAQNNLIPEELNVKTKSYYSNGKLADVSPDNISEAELNNIMTQLGITDQNQQNTYKRNLKWREDPNYNGDQKYKIDLSAKKYLSNLINAKDFNTINKLKGDNSTGDNNGNQ